MKFTLSTAKRCALYGVVSSCLIFGQGCSLFVPKLQPITLRATDPSAEIFVNDLSVGKGTVSTSLDRTKTYGVIARTPSGKTGAANINRRISTTGVLDLVGGVFLLVPFLGIFGPGFWELDPDNVVISVN